MKRSGRVACAAGLVLATSMLTHAHSEPHAWVVTMPMPELGGRSSIQTFAEGEAVAHYGASVFRTQDEGRTWTATQTPERFAAVSMSTPRAGYAVSGLTQLLRTDDTETWRPVAAPPRPRDTNVNITALGTIRDPRVAILGAYLTRRDRRGCLHPADPRTGTVAAVTRDSGRTWHQSALPVAGGPAIVAALDAQAWAISVNVDRDGPSYSAPDENGCRQWAVSYTQSSLVVTVDGGRTWSRTDIPRGPCTSGPGFGGVQGLAWASRRVLLAADQCGGVWRSDDGGRRFRRIAQAFPFGTAEVEDLDFVDERHGLLMVSGVRTGGAYRTSDGGATWVRELVPWHGYEHRASLAMFDRDSAVAISALGAGRRLDVADQ